MRKILETVLIGLMLTVSGGTVRAGPFDDGVVVYQRGDFATALRLFRPLAEQGNASAQSSLGLMYSQGQGSYRPGLPRSAEVAQLAAKRRDAIQKGLSPAQLVRAQEMARQCEARKFKGCD